MEPRRCPTCGWPVDTGWFDDARQAIVVNGVRHPVPAVPWKLLSFLRDRAGQLIPTERIWAHLYHDRADPPCTNTLRVHMSHLREHLQPTPYRIIGRKGSGYLFDVARMP